MINNTTNFTDFCYTYLKVKRIKMFMACRASSSIEMPMDNNEYCSNVHVVKHKGYASLIYSTNHGALHAV
jgi:hypothetical protein